MRGLAMESRPWLRIGVQPPAGELYKNTGGTTQTKMLGGFGALDGRTVVAVYNRTANSGVGAERIAGLVSGSSEYLDLVSSGTANRLVGRYKLTAGSDQALATDGEQIGREVALLQFDPASGQLQLHHLVLGFKIFTLSAPGAMSTTPSLVLVAAGSQYAPVYTAAWPRAFTASAERIAVLREAQRIVAQRGL